MRIDILTLFPCMFRGILHSSILGHAIEKKILDVRLCNFRNFTYDRHCQVDDILYGGGPGLLLKPEPIFRAIESIAHTEGEKPDIILMTPQGTPFQQTIARQLSQKKHLVLVCGHYEGFDERIRLGLSPMEISIGDYVLTGGEIPAMVILDAVSRLIPGVLGDDQSSVQESFSVSFLEHAQYTRPLIWREMAVPDVLVSGNHKKIREWQEKSSLENTQKNRPDLLKER